jgi:hypothetical protein
VRRQVVLGCVCFVQPLLVIPSSACEYLVYADCHVSPVAPVSPVQVPAE